MNLQKATKLYSSILELNSLLSYTMLKFARICMEHECSWLSWSEYAKKESLQLSLFNTLIQNFQIPLFQQDFFNSLF